MGNAEIMTGVQQIMIGSKCSSYENALAALKAVKASGYDGIELNEFMVKPTPALIATVADERNGYLAGVDVLCDGGCTNGKMFKK